MSVGAILWIIAGFIFLLLGFDVLSGDVNWVFVAVGLCVIGYPFLGTAIPWRINPT